MTGIAGEGERQEVRGAQQRGGETGLKALEISTFRNTPIPREPQLLPDAWVMASPSNGRPTPN